MLLGRADSVQNRKLLKREEWSSGMWERIKESGASSQRTKKRGGSQEGSVKWCGGLYIGGFPGGAGGQKRRQGKAMP